MAEGILPLLVEDDALIRINLQEELADAGFEMVAATNGPEAMSALQKEAARFRAVLTDIQIGPGPNGWDIARQARELVPQIPVVYMSGDSAHEWDAHGVPGSVMVTKPFVDAQIITAIATLMNQATPS